MKILGFEWRFSNYIRDFGKFWDFPALAIYGKAIWIFFLGSQSRLFVTVESVMKKIINVTFETRFRRLRKILSVAFFFVQKKNYFWVEFAKWTPKMTPFWVF